MVNFDTGDNPNRGDNALTKALKYLVALGYKPWLPLRDGTGKVFSYYVRDPRGNFFYLVARSTSPYLGQYFGTQVFLLKMANAKDVPLVLSTPEGFYAFDTGVLLETMKGTNPRVGEDMGNLSVRHGSKWDPTGARLYPIYRDLQRPKGDQATL